MDVKTLMIWQLPTGKASIVITHYCLSRSQYQINVSEIYSTLTLYDGGNYTQFTALAHVPLRPPNDYYSLSDLLSSDQSLDGSNVNMLAIVKHVWEMLSLQSSYVYTLTWYRMIC